MRQFTSRWPASVVQLANAGFSTDDAYALRRISMTLHRWHELECGDGNGCITRSDDNNLPYWQSSSQWGGRYQVPDRERGALKRLAKIMARYPGFASYVQGDPRGCALYIMRPDDVREGDNVDSCYNRGIAVYK